MILLVESKSGNLIKLRPSTKSEPGLLTKFVNWIRKSSSELDGNRSSDKAAAGESAQTSLPISDACQGAIEEIMDNLVHCIAKLRLESEKGRPVTSTEQLLKSKLIYFTDCRGQHELLPLFVHHISSALCVTRLTDKLDEIPQRTEYFHEENPIGPALRCLFSDKDTVQYIVNTVQSYSSQDQSPSIIIVGTHLDKLEEKTKELSLTEAVPEPSSGSAAPPSDQSLDTGGIETLEEKNKQLLEMLEPEFSSQLIRPYPGDKNSLLFPVDALNPGEKEKKIAHSILSAVECSGAREEKIPIWWSVLQLLLQLLAQNLGRNVLSRAECLEMAHLLNIGEESFNAALVYFDELNIIKYFPKVLPDVVFIDFQVPFDKVYELAFHSNPLSQDSAASSTYFTMYGVVSEECLEWFPRHYVPGIFTKEHLSKLLTHLLVFGQIPPPEGCFNVNQKYYIMPALTLIASEAKLAMYRVSHTVAAPLLVRFPKKLTACWSLQFICRLSYPPVGLESFY